MLHSANLAHAGPLDSNTPARVLVVDDAEGQAQLLRRVLTTNGFDCLVVGTGEEAFDACVSFGADVVLLDINLPGADGITVCKQLKAAPQTRFVPVLIMTGAGDRATCLAALEAGADDFLLKPLALPELRARVRSAARLKQYVDELDSVVAAIVMLGSTIEARDPLTNGHCQRLASYATGLGGRLGLPQADVRLLSLGGYLHDLGKIAVPDAVLFKPGALTTDEYRLMQSHTLVGDQICSPLKSLAQVRPIIRHHHEQLDGSGYPDGLKGGSVPLLAQIMSVVDVFDAMTTDRPYRRARPVLTALDALDTDAVKGRRDRALIDEFSAMINDADPLLPFQTSDQPSMSVGHGRPMSHHG
jgi:putative two-component system response regulator